MKEADSKSIRGSMKDIQRDRVKLDALETYTNLQLDGNNNRATRLNSIKSRSQHPLPGTTQSRQATVNVSTTSHARGSDDSDSKQIFETPKNQRFRQMRQMMIVDKVNKRSDQLSTAK